MASSINIAAYSDALVILGTAAVAVPALRRLGLNPIISYLITGAVVGPLGLGAFIHAVPLLYWLTVVDAKNVAGIAELGIVFLLFLIGLELSASRLMAMRRLVFGLGLLQVVVSTAIIAGLLVALAGQGAAVAVILAASLSLSSTAIVLELLSKQGRLTSSLGRVAFSILLAQDLAVVPLLLFVSIVGGETGASVLASLAIALVQAAVALAALVLFGRVLLRPLLRLVATTNSHELFIAAVLFVIVGAGVIANRAGLSMALGAFVAGLMLAETEYVRAIQATIEPFKGLLLGIFFFTVGMNMDFGELAREPGLLLAGVLGLIAVKSLVVIGLAKLFRVSWPAAVEAGLLLGPGGEFAFVSIGMAAALGTVTPRLAAFVFAVTAVTMAFTPLLSLVGRGLASRLTRARPVEPELLARPPAAKKHVVVIGHGRVGKVVCSLLKAHAVPFVAVDRDAPAVTRDRREGHDVFYGNATDPAFLKACGLMDAAGIVITIQMQETIDAIVETLREMRPDLLIVSRARDAAHASHLYARGVTDAVPETIESSLQLSEAALMALGIPAGPVIASVHEKRDEFRRELQRAAQASGRSSIHARPRRLRAFP